MTESSYTSHSINVLEGQLQSVDFSCSDSSTILSTLTNVHDHPDAVQFDEDDVFQCGRCRKQFRSLDTFIHHKRGTCSGNNLTFRGQYEDKPIVDISNQFITTNGAATSVTFDEAASQILTAAENSSFINSVNGSSVLHLTTPSMVLTDDSLTFSIPVDQHGSLAHIVAHGHNSSQILTVPENDLNSLINSRERYHVSSIDQISSPISSHGLLLTSLISSSGKESNLHVLSNIPSHIPTDSHESLENKIDSQLNSLPSEASSDSNALVLVSDVKLSPSPNTTTQQSAEICSDNQLQIESNSNHNDKSAKTPTKKNDAESKSCSYCGKVFKKIFNLHQHIRSHTGEKPFSCLICGRGFTQKSNVKKHMQTHKVWPKVKVTLPKEQISVKLKNSSSEVDANYSEGNSSSEKVEYIVNNVYVCQYCDESFPNHHKLKTHMIVHKNEKLFKCIHKNCTATFLEVEGLIAHIKTHEGEMEYRCQCSKVFNNLYDLGAHQYTALHRLYPSKVSPTVASRSYRCSKCNSKYSSAEALNHHLMSSSHNYPCSQCRLVFVCERYLRRHLKVHGSSTQWTCPQCNKHFKTENYLKSHLVIHSDSKPFSCECGALFNRRDKLTRHKRIHESRKKFKCPFKATTGCTREFYRKDKLKDHLLSHSRKSYMCSKCNKDFSWPTRLRHHQVEHHPEMLASTTCNTCQKIFKTKHHLKIHLCKGSPVETVKAPKTMRGKRGGAKTKSVPQNFKDDIDLEEEEDVMYGDCDIDQGDREESSILSGLTNVREDQSTREILCSDTEDHEDDGNGVLSTIEIGFEASVVSSSMDPLMAGD